MDPALREHEEQLAAVDAAIARDPTNEEWARLRADLLEVIALKRQLAEVQGGTSGGQGGSGLADAATSSSMPNAAAAAAAAAAGDGLKSYGMGEKCQVVFEQDGQWYNAKVVALAQDGYFVTYLGYGNTAQVDFAEVRAYVRPDTREWKAGSACMAISPADNRWYEGRIVNVKSETATVRFTADVELHEIEIDSIRVTPPAADPAAASSGGSAAAAGASDTGFASSSTASTAGAGAGAAAALPKQLEIRPDDSEEAVARKKKKLAMFKRQERREKDEQQVDQRRSSWQSFSAKSKTIKKSKNNHDPTWDPARDHSEMAGRVAIDKHANYLARNDH